MLSIKVRGGASKALALIGGAIACILACTAFSALSPTSAWASSYSKSGSTITIKASANEDITTTLNNALAEATASGGDNAPVTVLVPAGTHKISNSLRINSNTTLDLQGGTLQYASKERHNMIMSGTSAYNESSRAAGYNGFKNITIKNGTFASIKSNRGTTIRLSHATNVRLENLTLAGGGCAHQIEVAAIDGFTAKNCTFKNWTGAGGKHEEALQLDVPCNTETFQGVYLDGTPMKNVEITGCIFDGVPRGVGTHSFLVGSYHENIRINDNTFNNVTNEAIVGLAYYNCQITNNKIINCGTGILVQFFKNGEVADSRSSLYSTTFDGKKRFKGAIRTNAKTIISGNVITTRYTKSCSEIQGIRVEGRKLTKAIKGIDGVTIPAGSYYISGVTISNNKITTAGYGIYMIGTRSATISGNTITQKNTASTDKKKAKYDGILVEGNCSNLKITKNKIKNMNRNGIFVQASSKVKSVTSNTIDKCGKANKNGRGINFFNKSGCTGDISKNKISGCNTGGILISTNSTAKNIVSNTITFTEKKSKGNGIEIYKKSVVKGSVAKNTIKKANTNGISVSTSSAVKGKITKNKITSPKANGILIYNKSKAKGTTGNIITGAKGKPIKK